MTSPSQSASHQPEIARLLQEVAHNLERGQAVGAGLSPLQFNWRSEPGRWSIAQCFGHLNLVDGRDLDPIAARIADARVRNLTGSGPFRYNFLARYFVSSMEPPVKRKFKAPKDYVPPPDLDIDATMNEFRRVQNTLADLMRQADGLDLARVKIPFLSIRWIKMQLGARLNLLTAHDRRHLWQAEQVRARPDLPKS